MTTTTNSSGFYEFTGLGADTITITVDASTLPAGLTQTGDPGGSSSLDNSHTLTLNPGDDIDTVDFGYQGNGTIGDTVWLDLDKDGIEDSDEGGIGGVVITLTHASGFAITTTTTITGFYEFENLPPGGYTIDVDDSTLPGGVTQTGDPGGSGSLDGSHTLTLPAGGDIDTVDFGYVGSSSLGDTVWQDLDGDGVQDVGEPPIPGVTLTLTLPSGVEITTTTTISGFYQFTDLPAGTYTVDVDTTTLPSPLTQTGDPGGTGSLDDSHTQVLGANETVDTVDFGYRSGGSLGDTVWLDLNGDGVEDPGEPGIQGVVISLTLPGGAVITTTTAANGFYQFTGLGAGNHTVEIDPSTLPDGLTQTGDPDATPDHTHVYNLGADENVVTVDFGYIGSGSIGDTVWHDLNGDGVIDDGEPMLQSVVLTLTTSTGGVITATTTITGFYEFPNLPAGTYTVTVDTNTLPIGYSQSGDPDSTVDDAHTLTITTGETVDTVDFGYLTAASLGDRVWLDANGDGIQDIGELGVPGITVTLYLSGTGLVETVLTDPSGIYTFTNLLPGDYTVDFELPDGYEFSPVGEGSDPEADSDADPITGSTTAITIASGDNDISWDAGIYQPATLGDFVWIDNNYDGRYEFGEPGLPGITVTLHLSGTGPISTTVTNGIGFYEFDNLPPGEYFVEFGPVDGYYPTQANNAGDDDLDSDMNVVTQFSDLVVLESGDIDISIDAGFYQGGSIGDFVWEDINGNGIQDLGEPAIAGITVTLYLSGTGQITTTVTGPNGEYLFDDLPIGDYTVGFEPTPGYEIIPPNQGGDDEDDSDADPTTGLTPIISLGPNEDIPTVDTGLYRPTEIGNFVWADANGDGIQDLGELGFPGIQVNLILSGTGVISTTQTDGSGFYGFTNLPPGEYVLEFILPADYIVSPQERGDDPADDSNPIFLDNRTPGYVLESGDSNMTIDIGLYYPLQLGNYVWFDLNNDGQQDDTEDPLGGVVLKLLDVNGDPVLNPASQTDVYTTTTDIFGKYTFDYLPAGTYIVEIDVENFIAWDSPLYGFVSSLTSDLIDPGNLAGAAQSVTPDPDDDPSNTDDNGQNSGDPIAVGGVQSLPVDLAYLSEPLNDDSDLTSIFPDGSTNLTVDFGFYELLTLGNSIWLDENGNGIKEVGEPGIPAGVVLELLDADGNPVISPETGLPITTTTTSDGEYQFTHLAPGDYRVRISPENFLLGNILEGYASSTGSVDPDDDADSDDNGEDSAYATIDGIVSAPITLGYGAEPDEFADGDDNGNTNFTVDFGLVLVPTAVELTSFTARRAGDNSVKIRWATGSEIDNFGFRLIRSSTGNLSDAEQIHFENSAVTTGPGANYSFIDSDLPEGTYTYWLIDVETTGNEKLHGPVTISLTSGFQIYLPLISTGK